MGVKGLWSIVAPAGRAVRLESLSGRRVAVDASIWLHQFLKAMRDKQGNMIHGAHLVGFFRRICKLMFYGILPVFVYDGKTPVLKRQTIVSRRQRRTTVQNNLRRTAERLLSAQLRQRALDAVTQHTKSKAVSAQGSDAIDDVPEDASYFDATTNSTRPASKSSQKGINPKDRDEYDLPKHSNGKEFDLPSTIDPRLVTEDELRAFIDAHRNDIDLSQINIDSAEFKTLPIQMQHELIIDIKNRARAPNMARVEAMLRASETASDFSRQQIRNLVHRNALTERTTQLAQTAGVVKNPSTQKLVASLNRRRVIPRRVVGVRNRDFVLIKNDDVGNGNGNTSIGGWTMVARDQGSRVVDGLHGMQGFGITYKNDHETTQDHDLAPDDASLDNEDSVIRPRTSKPRQAVPDEDNDDDTWLDVTSKDYDETKQSPTSAKRRSLTLQLDAYVADSEPVENVVAMFEEMERCKRSRSSSMSPQPDESAQEPDQNLMEPDPSKTTDDDLFIPDDVPTEILDAEFRALAQSHDNNVGAGSSHVLGSKIQTHLNDKKPKNVNKTTLDRDAHTSTQPLRPLSPRLHRDPLNQENRDSQMDVLETQTGLTDDEFLASWLSISPASLQTPSWTNQDSPAGFLPPDAPTRGWFTHEILAYDSNRISRLLKWTDRRRGKSALGSNRDTDLAFLQRYLHQVHVRVSSVFQQPLHDDLLLDAHYDHDEKPMMIVEEEPDDFVTDVVVLQDSQSGTSSPVVQVSKPDVINRMDVRDVSSFLDFEDETRLETHERQTKDTSTIMNELEQIDTRSEPKLDIKSELVTANVMQPSPSSENAKPPHVVELDDDDDEDMEWETVNPVSDALNVDRAQQQQNESALVPTNINDESPSLVAGDMDTLVGADQSLQDEVVVLDDDDDAAIDVPTQMDDEMEGYADFIRNFSAARNDLSVDLAAQLRQELSEIQKQHRREQRDASDITSSMINETQELLRLFGLPYIVAATEAESQCAFLLKNGLVDGIVTDDSDVFLFGGHTVYKNMFNQTKYVELYTIDNIQKSVALTRERMIQLAFLLGSDYTPGLLGIGPVRSLEILNEWCSQGEQVDSLSGLRAFRQWAERVADGKVDPEDTPARKRFRELARKLDIPASFPDRHVRDAYLDPIVDANATKFSWGEPSVDAIREMLQDKLRWSQASIDAMLVPVVVEMNRRKYGSGRDSQQQTQSQQATLDMFFPDIAPAEQDAGVHKSVRVQNVLKQWTGSGKAATANPLAAKKTKASKSMRGKSRSRRGGRESSTTSKLK